MVGLTEKKRRREGGGRRRSVCDYLCCPSDGKSTRFMLLEFRPRATVQQQDGSNTVCRLKGPLRSSKEYSPNGNRRA